MSTDPTLAQAVARQLLLGRRESLTIASHLHCSVEAVNAALQALRADCDDCIALTQPYGQQPRFVVDVLRREPLTRVAWPPDPR